MWNSAKSKTFTRKGPCFVADKNNAFVNSKNSSETSLIDKDLVLDKQKTKIPDNVLFHSKKSKFFPKNVKPNKKSFSPQNLKHKNSEKIVNDNFDDSENLDVVENVNLITRNVVNLSHSKPLQISDSKISKVTEENKEDFIYKYDAKVLLKLKEKALFLDVFNLHNKPIEYQIDTGAASSICDVKYINHFKIIKNYLY